jgi:hypothetical protein
MGENSIRELAPWVEKSELHPSEKLVVDTFVTLLFDKGWSSGCLLRAKRDVATVSEKNEIEIIEEDTIALFLRVGPAAMLTDPCRVEFLYGDFCCSYIIPFSCRFDGMKQFVDSFDVVQIPKNMARTVESPQ